MHKGIPMFAFQTCGVAWSGGTSRLPHTVVALGSGGMCPDRTHSNSLMALWHNVPKSGIPKYPKSLWKLGGNWGEMGKCSGEDWKKCGATR